MVVFTCNHCGDSLQKPKVAKHYQFQCRKSAFLTCVDCHTDFSGEEYVAHTKCMTENERYGGKDYVSKPNSNKGERKQNEWINVIQNLLNDSKNLSYEEKNMLNNLTKNENIPRKKPKFLNFIRSAYGNRFNNNLVNSVWSKMEMAYKEATNKEKETNQQNKNGIENDNTETKKSDIINHSENNVAENQNNENICRENVKSENKNNNQENEVANRETRKEKKKSKKRKLEEYENKKEEEPAVKKTSVEISEGDNTDVTEASKFNWKNTILEMVQARQEISLKKLRKKIVARYLQHCPNVSHEKAVFKFEKKINKINGITIENNKVRVV